MTPHSRLTPDERQLATTHLCPSCCKRVLTFVPNDRYIPPAEREQRRPYRPNDKRRRIVDIDELQRQEEAEATPTTAESAL